MSEPASSNPSAASSRSRTPQAPLSQSSPNIQSTASYFSYPVSRVVSGLYRRLTDPSSPDQSSQRSSHADSSSTMTSSIPSLLSESVFMPKRTASPFQPPPLTPLTLEASGNATHQLLTRALAEEIRLLVPPRLQLVETWRLAYSLERDGSSLATLYANCKQVSHRSQRAGYVLVVRDTSGGAIFGAYLTDPPHPSSHFFGTGECFLWRASVLNSTPILPTMPSAGTGNSSTTSDTATGGTTSPDTPQYQLMTDEELERAGFPPPPSADTTHAVRSTTIQGTRSGSSSKSRSNGGKTTSSQAQDLLSVPNDSSNGISNHNGVGRPGSDRSGASTPERIRFKAFPYSGVNDYMMFCETGFLSVGGG